MVAHVSTLDPREHLEQARDNLEAAKKAGPSPRGEHFAALAQGHALTGILAALTQAPRTGPGEPRPVTHEGRVVGLLTRQHGATCSCERCYL